MNKYLLTLCFIIAQPLFSQGMVGNGGNSINFLSYLMGSPSKVSPNQIFKINPYKKDLLTNKRCRTFFKSAKAAWDSVIENNLLKLSEDGLAKLQNPQLDNQSLIFWKAFVSEDWEYLCTKEYFVEAEIMRTNGRNYLAINSKDPVKIYYDYKSLFSNQVLACQFSFRFMASYEKCTTTFNSALALHEVLGISHTNFENSSTFYVSSAFYNHYSYKHDFSNDSYGAAKNDDALLTIND